MTGDDFYAENLTIQNDWEKKNARMGEGAQAVALMITGDREVLRHVRLLGYQDTLYATSKLCHVPGDKGTEACHSSRQLFEDCYIEGHVDFIFGDSEAVFKNCQIHGNDASGDCADGAEQALSAGGLGVSVPALHDYGGCSSRQNLLRSAVGARTRRRTSSTQN